MCVSGVPPGADRYCQPAAGRRQSFEGSSKHGRRLAKADKAQIERITQLTRLVEGKPTKRTPEEILAAEKSAGAKGGPRPVPIKSTGGTPAE